MLDKAKKEKIVKVHAKSKADTGSAEVQIALLSEQIKQLSTHLKKQTKDQHSRHGLLKMVAKRRKLLNYLRDNHPRNYQKLIKKLKLKR